jgi:ribosome-interacting GTPase 1
VFRNCSVGDVCSKLHKDFLTKFKFSRVWGLSAKFDGQKGMAKHRLIDGDLLEIHLI